MTHLFRFEVAKCFNPKRSAVSFLLVVGFVCVILLGLWLQERRHGQQKIQNKTFADYLNASMCVVTAQVPALFLFRSQVGWLWHRALSRRSQNGHVDWDRMRRLIDRWLPPLHLYHPYHLQRLGVVT